MRHSGKLTVATLLAACGTCYGTPPVVDGTRDTMYPPSLWSNTVATQFGDNVPGLTSCPGFGAGIRVAINNSNTAGVSGAGGCVDSGAGVTTGFEIKIPFADIENPTSATFKLAGFINGGGHDFLSNQVIGGLSACPGNLGEPRAVNFDNTAGQAGDQFVTISNGSDTAATEPTIDGTLDAAFYGTALWTNTDATGFGNATLGLVGQCNGSEIDAVFARVVTIGGDKSLFIFIAGNLETNFNKADLFLDIDASSATPEGQNKLLGNNPIVDFNGLNRMGEANPGVSGDGLQFDAGFTSDYYLTFTNGNNPVTTFANFAETPTLGGGQGAFLGSAANPAPVQCTPGPNGVPSVDIAIGSELDNITGCVFGDRLYVFIGGNLETNGNRFDVFFDVQPGGQNTLSLANVAIDFNGLNRMGGPDGPNQGLTFDQDFAADYWLSFRNQGNPVDVFSWASFLRTGTPLDPGARGDVAGADGLLDFGSFDGGLKGALGSANNPINYDGQFCVRQVRQPGPDLLLDTADDTFTCGPNGSYPSGSPPITGVAPGTLWNPAPINGGIDVQGDLFAIANPFTPVAEIYSSYAPRLISADPFNPLGYDANGPITPPNPVNLAVPGLIEITINNSNVGGVSGDPLAPIISPTADVATGIEFSIRLDELIEGWQPGSPVPPIKIAAFINGLNHDFVSNQIVGGAAVANPGEPRTINFSDNLAWPGNQFVTVSDACGVIDNCPIDLSGNDVIDADDIFAFLNIWFGGPPGSQCVTPPTGCPGDWNSDGVISADDIFAYLNDWFEAVPGSPCP